MIGYKCRKNQYTNAQHKNIRATMSRIYDKCSIFEMLFSIELNLAIAGVTCPRIVAMYPFSVCNCASISASIAADIYCLRVLSHTSIRVLSQNGDLFGINETTLCILWQRARLVTVSSLPVHNGIPKRRNTLRGQRSRT